MTGSIYTLSVDILNVHSTHSQPTFTHLPYHIHLHTSTHSTHSQHPSATSLTVKETVI